MDRRLPVYLLVDCSSSMRGAPIEAVRGGLERLSADLMGDPLALETVWLSVITFATGAEQAVPLTEVFQFRLPELRAKGQSDMGAALKLLAERLDREVRPNTPEQKGDWKPVAFLMTDGRPGDAWVRPAKEIKARHDAGRLTAVAVGFGPTADEENLARVSPLVMVSESAEPEAFAGFLKWVSTAVSRSVAAGAVTPHALAASPPKGFRFNPTLWKL